MNKLMLLHLSFLSFANLYAQDSIDVKSFNSELKKYFFINTTYQNGYIFPTNDFIRGVNAESDTINSFQAFSISITKQTIGKKLWEQIFDYPEYGVGLYLADFHNPEEIGLPVAFYGYFKAPFHRWEKFAIFYDACFGLAFNWKNYSPGNEFNTAIGAKRTVYIDLGVNAEYKFSNRLALGLGLSLSHFSNGHLKEPNLGINTIAPKISLKYDLNKTEIQFLKDKIPEFKKKNNIYFTAFYGMKNIMYDTLNISASEKFEGESFNVFGVSSTFNRQISYKSKIGIGADITYDGSVDTQIAVDQGELDISSGPFINNVQISAFASYEFIVNKVALLLQPSVYLYRKELKNQTPIFYQRIGLKYNFFNNFYMGINLRAYKYHISDYIEWNIGFKLD